MLASVKRTKEHDMAKISRRDVMTAGAIGAALMVDRCHSGGSSKSRGG